jgi:hypothetical protein
VCLCVFTHVVPKIAAGMCVCTKSCVSLCVRIYARLCAYTDICVLPHHNHKSQMDYLLLSFILFTSDMVVPKIAAGMCVYTKTCVRVCLCVFMHFFVCICEYIFAVTTVTYTHICIRVCMYVCIYIYIYIYICTHTYTHKHTYIHT